MKLIFTIMILTITAPSSFIADCSPVEIYDKASGEPFYYSPVGGKVNLPIGTFTTDCPMRQVVFKPFPIIPQNAPIRNTGMRFVGEGDEIAKKLRFDAKNKASFYPQFNVAVFSDDILYHWFLPARRFAPCHEEGHNYFKPQKNTQAILSGPILNEAQYNAAYRDYMATEHKCDIYAYNKLMRNGYNPIQVRQAIKLLLDSVNPRVSMLVDKIHKVNPTLKPV